MVTIARSAAGNCCCFVQLTLTMVCANCTGESCRLPCSQTWESATFIPRTAIACWKTSNVKWIRKKISSAMLSRSKSPPPIEASPAHCHPGRSRLVCGTPPLTPTHPRFTPCRLPPDWRPCNLRRFLLSVFKSLFYGVSGPSVPTEFILAMFKNISFYVVLGSRRGPGRKQWHAQTWPQHGSQDGLTWGHIPTWAQHRPNMGPRWAQHSST